MRGRIKYHADGTRSFEVNGQPVTAEAFDLLFPSRLEEMTQAGQPPRGHSPGCWPMLSDALAVHPEQIEQARERNRRHGVTVDYAPDGRAILPDRGARRDLMKLEGCHDNEGGYSDDPEGSTASRLPTKEPAPDDKIIDF